MDIKIRLGVRILLMFLGTFISFECVAQCKKCDISIVKKIDSELGIKIKYNFDDKVLSEFFCTMDKKCTNEPFLTESGQILIVLLDAQLEKCVRVINKYANIDKNTILDIVSKFKIQDLPYDQIREQISKKAKRTDFENKLLQALVDRKKNGL